MEYPEKKACAYEAPQCDIVLFETQDTVFESDNYTPWNNPNPSI